MFRYARKPLRAGRASSPLLRTVRSIHRLIATPTTTRALVERLPELAHRSSVRPSVPSNQRTAFVRKPGHGAPDRAARVPVPLSRPLLWPRDRASAWPFEKLFARESPRRVLRQLSSQLHFCVALADRGGQATQRPTRERLSHCRRLQAGLRRGEINRARACRET